MSQAEGHIVRVHRHQDVLQIARKRSSWSRVLNRTSCLAGKANAGWWEGDFVRGRGFDGLDYRLPDTDTQSSFQSVESASSSFTAQQRQIVTRVRRDLAAMKSIRDYLPVDQDDHLSDLSAADAHASRPRARYRLVLGLVASNILTASVLCLVLIFNTFPSRNALNADLKRVSYYSKRSNNHNVET